MSPTMLHTLAMSGPTRQVWFDGYGQGAKDTWPQAWRAGARYGWAARVQREQAGWQLMRRIVVGTARDTRTHDERQQHLQPRTTLTGPQLIAAAYADWGLQQPAATA